MRIFGRFLYALLAVGFFLLAFTYSRDLMLNRYLEDVFAESLVDSNSDKPKYFYFYTSIPDYHNSDPIIEININGYEIMGYEVAQVEVNSNQELIVKESLYILVYSDTEDLSLVGNIKIYNDTTTDIKEISLHRFHTLNILNGVNETGSVYILKEEFFDTAYNRLSLVDKEGNNLLDTSLDIKEEDFIISSFLETFFTNNDRVPEVSDIENLADNTIYTNITHVATDYIHIFYIAMGIYFAVLIVATYLIFFRKRKNKYTY